MSEQPTSQCPWRTGAVVAIQPLLISKKEAAAVLGGMSVKYLEHQMRAGRINPVINAGRPMFTPEELQRYVADLPEWTPRR